MWRQIGLCVVSAGVVAIALVSGPEPAAARDMCGAAPPTCVPVGQCPTDGDCCSCCDRVCTLCSTQCAGSGTNMC
jgi:hypothetical protein